MMQRKCACGGTPGPTGECNNCRNKRLALQTKLAINQPGDRYEQEADRVAASVMSGGRAAAFSNVPIGVVQRDDKDEKQAPPPKPNNYGDAAKKIADAVQETPFGKQLKAKAEELGKEFLSSVEGKVVAGSALGGALAAIIATNSELPVPIPELPLDFIKPGLKMKITYEGPAQKPTNVGLTLTSGSGVSVSAGYTKTAAAPGKPAEEKAGLTLSIPLGGSPAKKKPGASESDKIAAETTQLRDEQSKLREAMKTPAEKKADEDFMKSYLNFKATDPLNPLNIGKKKEDSLLMRDAAGAAGPATAPPIVHDVLSSGGQPLDHGTRQFMESSLGHDFGRVRIHADARAAESARAVNAHAYTVGHHITFATGRHEPETVEGKTLLAHELAHVVQQSGGQPRPAEGVSHPSPLARAPNEIQRQAGDPLEDPLGEKKKPQLDPRTTRAYAACPSMCKAFTPVEVAPDRFLTICDETVKMRGPVMRFAGCMPGRVGNIALVSGAPAWEMPTSCDRCDVEENGKPPPASGPIKVGYIQTAEKVLSGGVYFKRDQANKWAWAGNDWLCVANARDGHAGSTAPWYGPDADGNFKPEPFGTCPALIDNPFVRLPSGQNITKDKHGVERPAWPLRRMRIDGVFHVWLVAQVGNNPLIFVHNWTIQDWVVAVLNDDADPCNQTAWEKLDMKKVTSSGPGKGSATPVLTGATANSLKKKC